MLMFISFPAIADERVEFGERASSLRNLTHPTYQQGGAVYIHITLQKTFDMFPKNVI